MEKIMKRLYDGAERFDLRTLLDLCPELRVDTCLFGSAPGKTRSISGVTQVYRALPPMFTAATVDVEADVQLFCEDVRSILHFRRLMCGSKRSSEAARLFYTDSTTRTNLN